MQTYTVHPTNERPIRFTGELLAEVESQSNSGLPNYSGQSGRWQELALYRTQKGTYIAVDVNRTAWAGERDTVAVARGDQDTILDCFGHGWLATELYQAAGLDTAQDIDE